MTYRVLTAEQVEHYRTYGYLRIPNFLSPAEVEKFKTACKKRLPGDIGGLDEFDHLTLQPRIVSVMKDLLGDTILYPGLSFSRTDDFPDKYGSRGYHSDVAYEDDNFSPLYPIINTGFYLQDHTVWSNALKVIPKSHTRKCIYTRSFIEGFKKVIQFALNGKWRDASVVFDLSPSINLENRPGDMLIWSTRIHHSGYGMRPRWFPKISLHPLLENIFPSWFFLPPNPERDVILTIYAAPSETFEEYMKVQKRKSHRREHFLASKLETPEVQALARQAGITIRNDGYHYAKNPENVFDYRGADQVSGKPGNQT